jgi:Zn-dependent protease
VRHRLNSAIAVAHPPVPVTFGRGGFVPPLALGGMFALVGFKVGLPIALAGFIGALAGTASLVVHELGHVRAARGMNGVRPVGISLVWLGAGARFEGAYRNGRDQLRVAVAGPVASMCVALSLLPIMVLPIPGSARKLLLVVVLLNLALAVVNLIPAGPLDGHRIVIGLLWSAVGSEAAARSLVRRAAKAWIVAELIGTAVVLVERPMLGLFMLAGGASLVVQRFVVRLHARGG